MIYREAKNSIKYYEEEEIFTNEYRENVDGTSEWIADNGIFFKEPEDRPIEENKIFIAAIQFYRSKDHVDGKYGKDDTSYNGEFGFDKFDKKVYAEGLIGEYEELKGIIPKEKIISGIKKYLSAYLSIWPPNVEGNKDNRKSKVKLYVKAEEAIPKLADSADIEFTSSDPNIIINGSSTINLTIDGQAKALNIECTGPFEKDVYIEAKAKGEPQVLGKLVIKANAIRYKTTIQPVEVSFEATKSTKTENITFIKNLVNDLNNKAFNQAYIYAELDSEIGKVTIEKKEFEKDGLLFTGENSNIYLKGEADEDVNPRYNDIIENRYAASKIKAKEMQVARENLQRKIRELLTQFDKKYTFNKENSRLKYTLKQYRNKIAKTAWEDLKVKTAYDEYEVAAKEYDLYNKREGLDKNKKLHFFYTEDIYEVKCPNLNALAYAPMKEGVAHIFKSALISKDGNNANSIIIHELGHSLGLYHTFQLGTYAIKEAGKRYKDDIQEEIKDLKGDGKYRKNSIKVLKEDKKKIEEYTRLAEKENLSVDEVITLKEIKRRYVRLQVFIDNKDTVSIRHFQDEFLSYFIGNQNIVVLEEAQSLNISKQENISTIEQIDKDMTKTEQDLEKLKEDKEGAEEAKILSRSKEQAHTEENYMDYNLYKEFDTDGNQKINENFIRKTLYQWQWRDMQTIGVSNGYFEEIK